MEDLLPTSTAHTMHVEATQDMLSKNQDYAYSEITRESNFPLE